MNARTRPYKIKQIPNGKKPGRVRLDFPHVVQPHERKTIETLQKFGDDLSLIAPSRTRDCRTADLLWRKEPWEMKAPQGNSSENIYRLLKNASPQSGNIIIDLQRTKRDLQHVADDVVHYIIARKPRRLKKVLILSQKNYCIIYKDEVKYR